MSRTFALVTVTYRGDLSLFQTLCASVDQHMPEVEHYVLVDRSDKALFAPFATDKRRIVDCSELLPSYRELNLPGRRVWIRLPFTVLRGWIYQQLAKIAFVQTLSHEAAVIVDSDAIFIRPIESADLFDDDAVRMYHCPGQPSGPPDQSAKWHNAAASALGMEQRGYTGADYISTAVIWSPHVVRAMTARIEKVARTSWDRALTRFFRFSEYVLYGVFSEHIRGDHQRLVSPTQAELCHCSWNYDLGAEEGRRGFVAGLQDHHRAVLIQSNLGMEDDQRAAILCEFEPANPMRANA